jgi:hypothetical protein
VQLGARIGWEWPDREIAALCSDMGRPGITSRFLIGLLPLKHIYGLSDEGAYGGSMTRAMSIRGIAVTNPRRVFVSGRKRGVFGVIKREPRRRSTNLTGHPRAGKPRCLITSSSTIPDSCCRCCAFPAMKSRNNRLD